MDPLVKFFHEHQDRMLEDLRAFVEWETPSTDKDFLDGFSRFLADYAVSAAGGRAEIVPASRFRRPRPGTVGRGRRQPAATAPRPLRYRLARRHAWR